MFLLPINLPKGFAPKVSVGDKLRVGQVIAQNTSTLHEEIIHLSDYGISPKAIFKSLQKNLGEAIKAGEIIAIKKKTFGKDQILSKISGTIIKIDEDTGDVKIKSLEEKNPDEINSPVDGTVEICNNDKIVIKTEKKILVAKDAVGESTEGELLSGEFSISSLTGQVNGKIVVSYSLNKVSVFKSLGLGANGIIAVELEDMDFLDFTEKKIGAAIFLVDKEVFKELGKYDGKKVFSDVKNKAIFIL